MLGHELVCSASCGFGSSARVLTAANTPCTSAPARAWSEASGLRAILTLREDGEVCGGAVAGAELPAGTAEDETGSRRVEHRRAAVREPASGVQFCKVARVGMVCVDSGVDSGRCRWNQGGTG